MNNDLVLYCNVAFSSDLSLEQVGEKISEALFGGVLHIEKNKSFDEYDAVRLKPDFLEIKTYVMQAPSQKHSFFLMMEGSLPPRRTRYDEAFDAQLVESLSRLIETGSDYRVRIDPLVSRLLDNIPEISIEG